MLSSFFGGDAGVIQVWHFSCALHQRRKRKTSLLGGWLGQRSMYISEVTFMCDTEWSPSALHRIDLISHIFAFVTPRNLNAVAAEGKFRPPSVGRAQCVPTLTIHFRSLNDSGTALSVGAGNVERNSKTVVASIIPETEKIAGASGKFAPDQSRKGLAPKQSSTRKRDKSSRENFFCNCSLPTNEEGFSCSQQ